MSKRGGERRDKHESSGTDARMVTGDDSGAERLDAAELGYHNTSMGRLIRDVRRQERTDLTNRFLSIDMDAKVGTAVVGSHSVQNVVVRVMLNYVFIEKQR